jgi:hypothetical protein
VSKMRLLRIKRDFCLITAGVCAGGLLAYFTGPPHEWIAPLLGFIVMGFMAKLYEYEERRHRVSGAAGSAGGQGTVVECALPTGTTSIIIESRGAGGWGSEDAKPKETKK